MLFSLDNDISGEENWEVISHHTPTSLYTFCVYTAYTVEPLYNDNLEEEELLQIGKYTGIFFKQVKCNTG